MTRLAHSGKLSLSAATFLNSAVGCHAFSILHHCTHDSISQGNEEFAKLENTVFRLASMLLFFDDGYRVAHRRHHVQANEPGDPDKWIADVELPVLGHVSRVESS